MTHMSDLSYLQRAVGSAWCYGWFIVYVYRWNRFGALRLKRLMRFELRSVITVLFLISMAFQLAYDIGSARLKYNEGFWVNPQTKEIESKPAQTWTESDTRHIEPLYYTLAGSLAAQNSVFFLLQSFWSYITKSVTKSSFMSSFEFKINIVFSCFVIVLFPTVQYLFRHDFIYREAIPQVIFSTMTLITGLLGIRTNFRLLSLINNAREISNETTAHVLQKLEYFKDMNMILTFSFFGVSVPLGIMSVDALLPNPVIAHNKFASDLLITNLNFFESIILVTLIMIFYPRKSGPGAPASASKHQSSKDARLPRFNDVKPQDVELCRREEPMRGVTVEDNRPWSYDVPAPNTAHHHRTLSNESRQATLPPIITFPAPAAKTPAAKTPGTKANERNSNTSTSNNNNNNNNSNNNSNNKNNNNRKNSKPEIVTSTIYYHDALLKSQQQQQLEQANDFYMKTIGDGSVSSDNTQYSSLPQRSFSQNSSHSASGHQRSASYTSLHPLIPKPSRHPTRAANSSVDYRPSRDYPSFVQETANLPNLPEIQRTFSPNSSSEPRHHQQQTINEVVPNTTRAPAATTQERSSEDSDREMIQVAYIRNMAEEETAYNDSKFYEDLGRAHSANPGTQAPRPFSPRHF